MDKTSSEVAGFTIVELMITLVIVAILMSLAAPSFQNTIRNNRTVTNANILVSTLNLARSEAIKRGVQVTLRHNGANSNNWDSGWNIFSDLNGDGNFDDDSDANLCEVGEDCILRTFPALKNGYTLRTTNYTTWMAYKANGMSRSTGLPNDTFRLCDDLADIAASRRIIVNTTGRVMTQTGGATSCP